MPLWLQQYAYLNLHLLASMKVVVPAPHGFDIGGLVKHPVTVDARFQKLLALAKDQRAKQMADDLIQVSTKSIRCVGL